MRSVNVEIETDIPARLDRLPWSRFHTVVVAALTGCWSCIFFFVSAVAIVELLIGVKAERRSLEDVARPISAR